MGKRLNWEYSLKTKLSKQCGDLYNLDHEVRHEQKKKKRTFYLLDQNRRQLKMLSYFPKGVYEDNI